MQFGILGPLQVLDGSRVVLLRRQKEKALLASLLLRAGETVSVDRLFEDLWGEHVPRTAKGSLQNLVSALRKALGRDRLRTESPGYVLEIEREHVDLFRFEQLLEEARALDARERAERLREALALWRGPLLADLAFEPFVLLEAPRLEQLKLAAHEELIEARLALGEHAELIPELETLVAGHPFDERLRGQLMLALFRAGRQADALDLYREGRRLLVQELGLEPSARLRELEQAILRQEPALSPTVSARTPDILPMRKLATVLYADLGPNEELDPEALARLLEECSAVARDALERHGGMVENLPGGAVLAFFGVPVAHEDYALRALRAALELRDELAGFGDHFGARIGVSTGEVFVGGAPSTESVAGAAVRVAKRLEEVAPVGEILLDASTARLVRDAVTMEAPGRTLREGELRAWRFRELIEGAPAIPRRLEAPLVGRDRELEQLRTAFRATCASSRCSLVVLAGEPGIGKTRLAREFISELEAETTVLVGRCVSYGQGATWLPLVEILRDAGADTLEALSLLLPSTQDGKLVARRVAAAIGIVEETAPLEEATWAFRRMFETLASRRPLVLVFEDVHWAEPTLLDVVEQLAERASGPILVLCLARPELLELRAPWEEHALTLAPLHEPALVRLVDSLHASLDAGTRARVVEVAEGNPLFAEQLVVYAEEEGARSLDVVPPSIEALLASRIDLLSPQDLEVLQSAAVIGRRFSRTAISALMAGGSTATAAQLRSLIQKSFVRESRTEGVLSFQHMLVRNVAYSTMPKRVRADLHERVAVWQEEHGDGVELDEIVGYHLEQAARYKAELGQHDAELAARAGERLAAAGRRALAQLDSRAALPLFERALLLTRPLRFDVHLEIDLARAQASPREQATVAGQAAERARENGNEAGVALALVLAAHYGMQFAEDPALDEVERLARAALPLLEDAGDHAGLALVWTALGRMAANLHGRYEENAIAAEEALRCWGLAGRRPIQLAGLPLALVDGPRPADEALKTLDSVLPPNPVMPDILFRAQLIAMLGRFEEAWEVALPAADRLRELGGPWSADPDMHLAEIAALAGDHVTAAVHLRRMCEELTRRGLQMALSFYAPKLGRCLCVLGHYDDAEQLAQRGRELASEQDFGAQALWRQVLALIRANRGNHASAETLAREAVAVVEATDALNDQGNALDDLAKVLAAAGRTGDAVDALEQALNRYERKKNLAMVAQLRPRLAELQPSASPTSD